MLNNLEWAEPNLAKTKGVALIFVITLVVSMSCSHLRTRQFIIIDNKSAEFDAGSWTIEPPRLVAFKNVIKLENIADTNTFWIAIKARHIRSEADTAKTDLVIDSVRVSLIPSGEHYWRKPTRIIPYEPPGSKFFYKAFDFYRDQGIVIPLGIDSVLLDFKAVLINNVDSALTEYPVRFKMVRDERTVQVPLLRQ